MKILFIGVGEALDADQPNTSILVQTDNQQQKGQILLDCGFTTPHQYFKLNPSAEQLELVWISHFHGDHFLGVPLLVLRFWEMNRSGPLIFVGQKGIADKVTAAVELAYPGLKDRLGFSLVFMEVSPDQPLQTNGVEWQTAFNEHSQPCLSLRLNLDNRSLFYSGDGRPTPGTLVLAGGCDVIIHEAYRYQEDTPGHGSISGCIDFARRAGVPRLALLHIQHSDRQRYAAEINNLANNLAEIEIIIPESGDIIEL